jgi:hypothetical protein
MAKTDETTQFGKVKGRSDDDNYCGPHASLGLVLHPGFTR